MCQVCHWQHERSCVVLQVTTCHVNPVNSNLLMTSSNDWTAKIFDIRHMSTAVDPDKPNGAVAPLSQPLSSLSLGDDDHMNQHWHVIV